LGELTALPQTPSCIKGGLLLSGRRGMREVQGGKEGKGREMKGREKGGEGCPQLGSLDPPVLK